MCVLLARIPAPARPRFLCRQHATRTDSSHRACEQEGQGRHWAQSGGRESPILRIRRRKERVSSCTVCRAARHASLWYGHMVWWVSSLQAAVTPPSGKPHLGIVAREHAATTWTRTDLNPTQCGSIWLPFCTPLPHNTPFFFLIFTIFLPRFSRTAHPPS